MDKKRVVRHNLRNIPAESMFSSTVKVFGRFRASTEGRGEALSCMASQLPGLVLVGLCLRHKFPLTELNAIFPDFNMSWIESQLSHVMSDPTISRWYFENIDRFDQVFVGILGVEAPSMLRPEPVSPVSFRDQSPDCRVEIPSMPVARSPLTGWFRNDDHGAERPRLSAMPSSTCLQSV